MGTASAATSVDVFFSHNNQTFFKSEITLVIGGAGDFSLAFPVETAQMKLRVNDPCEMTLILVKKTTSIL